MLGMSRDSGKNLADIAHLSQSIDDILRTRLGTRIMRENYGTKLYDLLDEPLNGSTFSAIYAEVARAITEWEPRFNIVKVGVDEVSGDGIVSIRILGVYNSDASGQLAVDLTFSTGA